MGKREQILESLNNSYAAMIAQLNEVDKQHKIYPLWTIREIVAHLSGWDDTAIEFAGALVNGKTPPVPAPLGPDLYNQETVSTREALSYDHIVREYMDTRRKLITIISQMTEEMLIQKSILPWGGEGSLEDIVQVFGPHEMEHAMDVKKIIEENNKGINQNQGD
jgi:hypothetical protein